MKFKALSQLLFGIGIGILITPISTLLVPYITETGHARTIYIGIVTLAAFAGSITARYLSKEKPSS